MLAGAVATVLATLIAYWIYTPAPPPPKPHKQGTGNPDEVTLSDIQFTQVKDGVREWSLLAKRVRYRKDPNVVHFELIQVTYYLPREETLLLSGREGSFNMDSKDIQVTGEVELIASSGYRLKVPQLSYQAAKNQITTPDEVLFSGPSMSLKGKGLTFEVASQKLTIHREAKAQFYGKKIGLPVS